MSETCEDCGCAGTAEHPVNAYAANPYAGAMSGYDDGPHIYCDLCYERRGQNI